MKIELILKKNTKGRSIISQILSKFYYFLTFYGYFNFTILGFLPSFLGSVMPNANDVNY